MKISKRLTLGTLLCSMILVVALMFATEMSLAQDDPEPPNCTFDDITYDCWEEVALNCYCIEVCELPECKD